MIDPREMLGAIPTSGEQTTFRVWAPNAERVDLHLVGACDRLIQMSKRPRGYFDLSVEDAPPASRYWYRLDGEHDLPDPASRSQPEGVHGPSEVIDPSALQWSSEFWRVPDIADFVIYELHIGTFTPAGTFESAIRELDRLSHLGITAIELMPITEFPGSRNWGYDGSYPFAAESSYGGPTGLARLVDACHQRGLAVILDVVYNHFGPDGSYAGEYGYYFTDRYRTPWGNAINFDGPGSDEVRRFFLESALYWLRDLRVDAFRVDAAHAIYDQSAFPFVRQLVETIHRTARMLRRQTYLIAESDLNDPRVIQPAVLGGWGFDAQWSDDLHHALHVVLTGEHGGIYRDFGRMIDIKRGYQCGFAYTGQYSVARQRSHGAYPAQINPSQLVVCSQNHDQVGNRAFGDRLTEQLDLEQLKLAAASILLSPFLPLLFMGEEYGETAPFQYFTSHSDQKLIEAVRRGRAADFSAFGWSDDVPDPQAVETFEHSKLRRANRNTERGRTLEAFYRELIRLRREVPALRNPSFGSQDVELSGREDRLVAIQRGSRQNIVLILLNFDDKVAVFRLPYASGRWNVVLDSSAVTWNGPRSSISPDKRFESGETIEISAHSALVLDRLAVEAASEADGSGG
jgi:maltooligosyltrehalose trehalohydrolase